MAVGLCLVLLGACGESKPPVKTVLDPQVQALKKAREVEQKLQDAAAQQREQMEKNQ
jgi:hypothetical protein